MLKKVTMKNKNFFYDTSNIVQIRSQTFILIVPFFNNLFNQNHVIVETKIILYIWFKKHFYMIL